MGSDKMSTSNNSLKATVTELLDIFRESLLAAIPAVERAKISWSDQDMYDDWERIARAHFDSFVRSPIDYARDHSTDEFPLARYDIDTLDYTGFSWIEVTGQETPDLAVVRFLSRDGPFDTIEAIPVGATNIVAGYAEYLPWSGLQFALVRQFRDGKRSRVTEIETEG